MKKILIVCNILLSFALLCPDTDAKETENSAVIDMSVEESGIVKNSDENLNVSEVMTYDEIINQMANDMGITYDESQKIIDKSLGIDGLTKSRISARSNTYRSISDVLNVSDTYKPSIVFYCQTNEGGTFASIVKVLNVNMNRLYQGISKQFGGSVYVNLESASTIYYTIDGDFYNNGTTTIGGGISIGIGQSASVNFNATSTSNHYKAFYVSKRRRWPY